MNRIILADNQAIFRAGAARVLALEDDMRIVAQCEDLAGCRMRWMPTAGRFFCFLPACNWTMQLGRAGPGGGEPDHSDCGERRGGGRRSGPQAGWDCIPQRSRA